MSLLKSSLPLDLSGSFCYCFFLLHKQIKFKKRHRRKARRIDQACPDRAA